MAEVSDVAAAYTAEFVLASLPPGSKRILEVGCGRGELARMLVDSGLEVVAIDGDAQAAAEARERGVDAHVALWPHFAAGGFDAVLFTRSLHHINPLDDSVRAAFACLRPGGRIVVEDFAYDEAPEPTLRWFRSVARIVLAAAGERPPDESLAGLLRCDGARGDWWHREHDHGLHGASALEESLRRHGAAVEQASAAYYFRYLIPAVAADGMLPAALLEHELEMIALALIHPLGRRFVAARRGG